MGPSHPSVHMNDPFQRRRSIRHRVEAAVLVWSIASNTSRAWRGHCLNLSEGGAGLIVGGPWMRGQVVRLELALPNSNVSFPMTARVAHRNRLYCGLEFLDEVSSKAIKTLLAS